MAKIPELTFENFNMDEAVRYTNQNIEAAIADIRAQLLQPGTPYCLDCGHTIPLARRRALPSATRCLPCQERCS